MGGSRQPRVQAVGRMLRGMCPTVNTAATTSTTAALANLVVDHKAHLSDIQLTEDT